MMICDDLIICHNSYIIILLLSADSASKLYGEVADNCPPSNQERNFLRKEQNIFR